MSIIFGGIILLLFAVFYEVFIWNAPETEPVYKNLIFDLDDTLIYCGKYYQDCKDRFVKYQEGRTGLPAEFINSLLSKIDLECTTLPYGFSIHRYPRSFSATSAVLDTVCGNEIDESAMNRSFEIGNQVFDAEYECIEGSLDTLHKYVQSGYNVFILTKGAETMQWNKIEKHGMDKFIHPDRIYVVDKKTSSHVSEIIEDWGLNVDETMVIGDSLRDDIGSAIGAGCAGTLVSTDKPTWAYENTNHIPTYTIKSVCDLPSIVPFSTN